MAFCVFVGSAAGGSAQASTPSGTMAFAATSYAVDVTAGTANIVVTRTGGAAGAASVNYITINGTATSAVNYTGAQGALKWASGDTAPKTFTVKILTPAGISSGKTFSAHLWNPVGAVLGTAQDATVAINSGGSVQPPPTSGTTSGTMAFAATSYAVDVTAGTANIVVTRTGGAAGAASVNYITVDGTATSAVNYTGAQGALNWANGDTAPKAFTVKILDPAGISSGKTFSAHLWNPVGAVLGTAQDATVAINGGGTAPSAVSLSAAGYGVAPTAGSVTLSVQRTGAAGQAASVNYATAPGTAAPGLDYATTQGTLAWAAGDMSTKTIQVPIYNPADSSSSETFNVTLSNPIGMGLSTPATATVTIAGTPSACAQSPNSWVTTGNFSYIPFGNYVVNNDNWGNLPGQQTWANSEACWGTTASPSNTDIGMVRGYPNVTRGWSGNQTMMQQLSTPGTNDWTTKSGMGIPVSQLTKARVHWASTGPLTPGSRWMGLMDIYFHPTATPAATEWPPFLDLMIDQSLVDQVVGSTTYYALVASQDHATTVTLGGNKYLVYIDDSGETTFHQPGGHNIHLFQLPTAYTTSGTGPNWGVPDAVTDVAAVIHYFMQSNPVDDAGQPLMNSAGTRITSPLITSNLYLNAINAGWEIDVGAVFSNTALCIAMQNEPDCN